MIYIVEERWHPRNPWVPVLTDEEDVDIGLREFNSVEAANEWCKRQKTIFRQADPDFRIVEIQRRIVVPNAGE